MKKLYILFISCLFITSVFAQTNIAIVDGSWSSAATWSEKRLPRSGEVVEIPQGITVQVTGTTDQSASDLHIKVWGTLHMNNGRISLGSNSKITLYEDAQIVTTKYNSADKISIGGIEKYNGAQGTLTGLLVASSTTGVAPNGFMAGEPVILPVKFASFKVAAHNSGVLVKWSTAQEVDAAYFEVQRSTNGSNWVGIGKIAAAGNSSQLMHYQFTDHQSQNGTMYYRIKQADQNGKAMYTSVQAIAATGVKPIRIIATNQLVAVQFTQPVKEKLEVLVINRAGQVMARQRVESGTGNVVLNGTGNLKGAYFVTVCIGAHINTTQQIIL